MGTNVNNILVVSGDRLFVEHLKAEFSKKKDQYLLFTADDGPVGLDILNTQPIDFVAASLNLPQMDGIQFLTFLRQIKPAVPTIVITSNETTYMGGDFLKLGIIKVLLEPVTADRLIDCIQEVLFLKTQQGRLQGISIINFLQLIEMEKKTYLLEVRNPAGGMGLFYFHEGILFDALCGEQTAESAALEMITWENVEIHFRTPPTKKVKRRIEKTLMSLLMDGVLLKDEKTDTDQWEEPEPPAVSAVETKNEAPTPDTTRLGSEVSLKKPNSEPKSQDLPESIPALEPDVGAEMLQELYGLRGVKAVSLLDQSGRVLGSLGSWFGSELDKLSDSVFMVLGGAMRMVRNFNLARISTFTLESNDATILCVPVGTHLLVILASDSKTLGIIRQKSMKMSQEFENPRP
jgi:DNA-binding response OmpR family regulator/predicted regulator of Ras-like GTPase activity (Roadblock/LC7/MglB family)